MLKYKVFKKNFIELDPTLINKVFAHFFGVLWYLARPQNALLEKP